MVKIAKEFGSKWAGLYLFVRSFVRSVSPRVVYSRQSILAQAIQFDPNHLRFLAGLFQRIETRLIPLNDWTYAADLVSIQDFSVIANRAQLEPIRQDYSVDPCA